MTTITVMKNVKKDRLFHFLMYMCISAMQRYSGGCCTYLVAQKLGAKIVALIISTTQAKKSFEDIADSRQQLEQNTTANLIIICRCARPIPHLITALIVARPKANLFVQVLAFSWRINTLPTLCVTYLEEGKATVVICTHMSMAEGRRPLYYLSRGHSLARNEELGINVV